MPAPYTAKAVANYFLDLAAKEGNKTLSPMKIQKLIYFAHGWHLAIRERPLITEEVQAWKFGPVIQSVYHEFKRFGAGPIQGKATDVDENFELVSPEIDNKDKDVIELLNAVWKAYGQFSGIQLSNITHQEGTPWEITWKENAGLLEVGIDNEEIKKFFLSKSKKNVNAAAAG